ncbi:penicillin-binding protein 1A [Cetobacterium ceti]|uniref:Penicillin-binding protein 1A n=1 Tax=Cetobacterium ceti TaxID=180163 RepID=A0A1T4NJ73_9FUSO|nr:PBP1A family penicillin-binding protein [Cetobacterium ceti]SJZ79304.1 penicillin-binding protein 1A [Cetobacterium ceti]
MNKKILKYLAICLFLFILSGFGAIYIIFDKYSKELPDVSTLVENYAPSIPTTIYDRNGEVIDVIYREVRDPVQIEKVPNYVKDAFLAIEDRRFYSHHGIDPLRLMSSILVNIKSGRAAQGASTLTQQLARNAFLTHEKKLSRKIKEAIITIEIEKKYTKNEILEKYLNEIYFGSGAYGIETASKTFFRKNVENLNLAEAALLAGIPNRPELYNPRKHLSRALYRQKLILAQMKKFGFISEDEYERALKQKFINEKKLPKDFKENEYTTVIYNESPVALAFNAPDFTDMIESFLLKNFDPNLIYTGGLKVYTTLDLNMQKVAKEVFENYSPLKKNKKLQGAMVTIDSKNGNIVSIVGGKNFKSGNYNRALFAQRQLGSSFKPFVYFSALDLGYEMNLVEEDSRIVYGKWAPRNYGDHYRGNMTILDGFDRSQNIVAIKLLDRIGYKKLHETVEKANGTFKVPDNLTLALGSFEATPLELARSYAIFSNGGYAVDPTMILKIDDKYGNTIYRNTPKIEQRFNPLNISLMTYMLKNSVKTGTSRRAIVKDKNGNPIEQGGKTGTTNKSRTTWFAGITPEYVTTIYLGNDDNSEVKKATGGGLVAPLWGDYYQALINKGLYTPGKFEFLNNYIKNGDLVLEQLDTTNGLISNKYPSKTYLLRRGKMEVEKKSKYKYGIEGVINGTYLLDNAGINTIINNNITPPSSINTENNVEKNTTPSGVKSNLEKDSIFNRIFRRD